MKKTLQALSMKNELQYYGLENQGATCYLNVVLQCLFMTQEFRDTVKSYDKAPKDCGEDLLRHLQKLFQQLSENVATTKGITTSLGIRNVHEQQDAVEYYRKILKAVGRRTSKVFEGKMDNITKCISCGNINKNTNSFISILLPIKSENNEQHVEKSLKTYFEHLPLDQEDWMYCDSCDQKTPTETWSEINECPSVLTLHLKRFDFDYNQMRYVKNSCALHVPLSLDIENEKFYLYAVINHKGGYSGGHYDALIKSDQNQKWYSFDDCTVTESEASLQGSKLPYMLMYRKENTLKDDNPVGSNPAMPLRILLLGPPGTKKSLVGNLILDENFFPIHPIEESIEKTVGNITIVDTPNLFTLKSMSWAKELKRCITLCHPGPNVILWVMPLSKFSDYQQGLFHNIKKRLGKKYFLKHTMIIFTNGRKLQNLEQPINISRHKKVKKVVRACRNRYYVINSGNSKQASELTEQLVKMVARNRESYCTFKQAIMKAQKASKRKTLKLSCISAS